MKYLVRPKIVTVLEIKVEAENEDEAREQIEDLFIANSGDIWDEGDEYESYILPKKKWEVVESSEAAKEHMAEKFQEYQKRH